jgi:hypothetical protein
MSIAPVSLGTIADIVPTNIIVPPIDYTSRDYTSLINDLLTLIPSYLPEWTDRSPGDFGIVLLELFAYMGDILNYYSDRIANEAFIATAQQRQSVLNLAALLDYAPHGNVAAVVSLPSGGIGGLLFTISQPSPQPVLIPANTQVSTTLTGTQTVIFETTQDLWIYGDGIYGTLNATSTGLASQQYVLQDPTQPWPTYLFTGGGGNQIVIVGGVQWTLAPGNSFVGQTATATMYTVINGNTVLFGGGTTASPGAIPGSGAAILIYYSTTALSPGTPITAVPTPASQYSGQVSGIQGMSQIGEGIGISDGTPNQQYTLFNTPVVDGSVHIFVDEGNGPTEWIYHPRLIDAFASEGAYTLSVDANGVVTVSFGDNITGRIPAPGAFITANYLIGGGAIGNVAANSLTQLPMAVSSAIASVTNTVPAVGGADAESIDHIRIHAPMSITAINRAVTLDDYAALVLNIASIAKAATLSTAYNAVNIYIHPAGDFFSSATALGNAVAGMLPSITNSNYTGYMDDKKMVGTSINILPPQYNKNGVLQTGYVPIDITGTIQVLPQYHQSVVQSAAQAAVQNLLLFSMVDFGWRTTLSSIYHTLMEVEGVDYVNVSVLCRDEVTPQTCADVQCAVYEIPQAHTITINANGGVVY